MNTTETEEQEKAENFYVGMYVTSSSFAWRQVASRAHAPSSLTWGYRWCTSPRYSTVGRRTPAGRLRSLRAPPRASGPRCTACGSCPSRCRAALWSGACLGWGKEGEGKKAKIIQEKAAVRTTSAARPGGAQTETSTHTNV